VAENIRPVPIGETAVSTDPDDVLVVYGLGSCVVVCLHDPLVQVGGILHALLPTPGGRTNGAGGRPAKFVDRGTPFLIDSLEALGAKTTRLIAQLCGGARMLVAPGFNGSENIGQRNVRAAEMALQAAGLEVWARTTGGHTGRTIKFYVAKGQVTVRTLGQAEQILAPAVHLELPRKF
jgi:chemotaxis protein CheD